MAVNTEELRRRIATEPDFIALKRFDFSLEKMLDRYPDGAPPRLVAQALLMAEEELDEFFEQTVAKLRSRMGVQD
jgi:hypothetical protein